MPGQLPSGRHGLPREYVVQSQRTRLLDAAVRIAGTDGYAGMTVSAVIARAGVSRRTFYEFFEDREDLFLAAFDVVVDRALDGARAVHDDGGGAWPERLGHTLNAGLASLAAHPREARLAFVEVLAAGPRALRARDRALQRFTPFVAPGHESAAAAGVALAIPPLMEEAIVGAVFEVVYSRVLQGRAEELPELADQLLFCALSPFLGPLEADAHVARMRRDPASDWT